MEEDKRSVGCKGDPSAITVLLELLNEHPRKESRALAVENGNALFRAINEGLHPDKAELDMGAVGNTQKSGPRSTVSMVSFGIISAHNFTHAHSYESSLCTTHVHHGCARSVLTIGSLLCLAIKTDHTCRSKQRCKASMNLKLATLLVVSFLGTAVVAQFPESCACPDDCVCKQDSGIISCDGQGMRHIPVELNSCSWPGIHTL